MPLLSVRRDELCSRELENSFLKSLQLVHPITCDQYDVCAMVLFFSAKAKLISFLTNFRGQCFRPEAVTKSCCHNIFLITKTRALLLINVFRKDSMKA